MCRTRTATLWNCGGIRRTPEDPHLRLVHRLGRAGRQQYGRRPRAAGLPRPLLRRVCRGWEVDLSGGFGDQRRSGPAEAQSSVDSRDVVVTCRQEDGFRSHHRASATSAAVTPSARPRWRAEGSVPTPTISLTPASCWCRPADSATPCSTAAASTDRPARIRTAARSTDPPAAWAPTASANCGVRTLAFGRPGSVGRLSEHVQLMILLTAYAKDLGARDAVAGTERPDRVVDRVAVT